MKHLKGMILVSIPTCINFIECKCQRKVDFQQIQQTIFLRMPSNSNNKLPTTNKPKRLGNNGQNFSRAISARERLCKYDIFAGKELFPNRQNEL